MQSLSHMPKGSAEPSLESVAFQDSMLFKELTLAATDLRREKAEDMPNSEAAQRLGKIVKHHTNLSITFSIDQYDPCIEVPRIDRNNPLVNDWMRDLMDSSDGMRLINNAKNLHAYGYVNVKDSTVHGVFQDVNAIIHLPQTMLASKQFTDEEWAAIMLHEIGHFFTYCEYISRSVRTNQVLAGLARSLDKTEGVDKREALLTTAKEALRLSELDPKELAKSTNLDVINVVMISNVVTQTRSELGTNIYDNSSWEMLADQFAARHGAGVELATALNKLYKGFWNISFRSLPAYLFMEATKLLLTFSGVGTTIGLLLIAIDSEGGGDYDRPGARLLRVRNQIVENLKNKKLPPKDVEELTEDLGTIDHLLSQINDRRQFLGVVLDVVFPYFRKARSQYELQRDLENIAMNEIFARSANLRAAAYDAKKVKTSGS